LFAGLGGAMAVVAIALLAFVGYHLLPGTERVSAPPERKASAASTEKPPAAVRTPAPAPPTTGQGVLIVDALPWAEIVSIVGQNGVPQVLGSTRYTPTVVHLPAGAYTISLRHPQFGSSQVNVTVRAAAVSQQVVDLGRIDPHQYLKDAGL
jgi:hypothetical protein